MTTTQPPSNIITPTTALFQKALAARNEPKPKSLNYPAIAVVGDSGTGKSRSIKNLPSDTTAIINCESKMLSFQGGEKFPYHFDNFSTSYAIDDAIKGAISEPIITHIVIDSFTKYLEILLSECKQAAKGYDIWNMYNDRIAQFLDRIKKCGPKFMILTGIPELVKIMNPNGAETNAKRLAVQGKQWEGKVEKEFTLVLFTDVRKAGDKISYGFSTNTDGYTSAKTPEGMFPEGRIDNDLKLVCDRIKTFCNL